jgi:polyisoprenoid-binding protein YceI
MRHAVMMLLATFAFNDAATTEIYTIDPNHTLPVFEVNHVKANALSTMRVMWCEPRTGVRGCAAGGW